TVAVLYGRWRGLGVAPAGMGRGKPASPASYAAKRSSLTSTARSVKPLTRDHIHALWMASRAASAAWSVTTTGRCACSMGRAPPVYHDGTKKTVDTVTPVAVDSRHGRHGGGHRRPDAEVIRETGDTIMTNRDTFRAHLEAAYTHLFAT